MATLLALLLLATTTAGDATEDGAEFFGSGKIEWFYDDYTQMRNYTETRESERRVLDVSGYDMSDQTIHFYFRQVDTTALAQIDLSSNRSIIQLQLPLLFSKSLNF